MELLSYWRKNVPIIRDSYVRKAGDNSKVSSTNKTIQQPKKHLFFFTLFIGMTWEKIATKKKRNSYCTWILIMNIKKTNWELIFVSNQVNHHTFYSTASTESDQHVLACSNVWHLILLVRMNEFFCTILMPCLRVQVRTGFFALTST